MLCSEDLFFSITDNMPGASWEPGKPQSIFLDKCAQGFVAAFTQGVVSPGPCSPTNPTPHTHTVMLNGSTFSSTMLSCGFGALTPTLIAHMTQGVVGLLSNSIQFSIAPDGCPPHNHILSIACTTAALANTLRLGVLAGSQASIYFNAIAQGVLTYIPDHISVGIISHAAPPGLHVLS